MQPALRLHKVWRRLKSMQGPSVPSQLCPWFISRGGVTGLRELVLFANTDVMECLL